MHTVYFGHIHSTLTLTLHGVTAHLPILSLHHACFFLNTPQGQVYAAPMCMVWSHPLGHSWPAKDHTPKGNCLNGSSTRHEGVWTLLPGMLNGLTLCMQPQLLWVQWRWCPGDTVSPWSSSISGFSQSFQPPFQNIAQPWGAGWHWCPIYGKMCNTHYLHLNQLWVSSLTVIHSRKRCELQ